MMAQPAAKEKGAKLTGKDLKEKLITFPLYVLVNPFKGFDAIKHEGRGSMLFCLVIMFLLGVSTVYGFMGRSFLWRGWDTEVPALNLFWTAFNLYAPILLICLANWTVTTITNGNGRFKEIFQVYCYAIIIHVFCEIVVTVLSNFLTAEEMPFLYMLSALGNIILYFYLFIGLVVVHEYTFLKGIVTVILTIVAMLFIVLILSLFFSLVSELIFFFVLIFTEIEAFL